MKPLLLIFAFFAAGYCQADQAEELSRIHNDMAFVTYELSLDGKPSSNSLLATQVSGGGNSRHSTSSLRKAAADSGTTAAPPTVTRAFSAKTLWADLDVTVLDHGTSMDLQIKSSKPASGWMLQKGDSNNIIFRGNVEEGAENFQIHIPAQYSSDLGLTVIVTDDDSQNPAFIRLK